MLGISLKYFHIHKIFILGAMQRKLTLILDEKIYQRLLQRFSEDENALREYAAKILEKESRDSAQDTESDETRKGLEDYLKKGTPGTRSYGIKGQGW